jgi:hypothetical protein
VAYKDVGVGVGVGWSGPDPAALVRDRAAIQQELGRKVSARGQGGIASRGVSVFFLRPRGKVKIAAIELTYYDGASPTVAPIFPSGP